MFYFFAAHYHRPGWLKDGQCLGRYKISSVGGFILCLIDTCDRIVLFYEQREWSHKHMELGQQKQAILDSNIQIL